MKITRKYKNINMKTIPFYSQSWLECSSEIFFNLFNQSVNHPWRKKNTCKWDFVTEGAHFIASFKISPQRAAKSLTILCNETHR